MDVTARRTGDTRGHERRAPSAGTRATRRLRQAGVLLLTWLSGVPAVAQARLDAAVPPARDAAATNSEDLLGALGWAGIGLVALAALVGFAIFSAVTADRSRRPGRDSASIVDAAPSRRESGRAEP